LKNRLLKLVVFIPENYLEKVKDAVFEAGAGVTGNYDKCSFSTPVPEPFVPEKTQIRSSAKRARYILRGSEV